MSIMGDVRFDDRRKQATALTGRDHADC